MKNKLFIIFTFLNLIFYAQSPGIYPRILARLAWPFCENEIKVKDVKVATCSPDNCHSYLYPVLIEEFDNQYDLPNKWRFDLGYTSDDNVGLCNESDCFSTWFGYGFFDKDHNITNNNVKIENGALKLIIQNENVIAEPRFEAGLQKYAFTSGMIQSLSQFEYGTFEASIQIPSANKLFPAFWLLGKLGNYSEIDIFEFEDGKVSGSACDLYNDHKMTLHMGSMPKKNECLRGDKYPMDDINVPHIYKLEWNKYEVSIYVDGQKKGYATRYYDNNRYDNHCNYSSSLNHFDPLYSYNCNTLQGLEDNWYETIFPSKPDWWKWWFPPWPNPTQYIYYPNKIRQDSYFASKDRPMSLIINNTFNRAYKGTGEDLTEFGESSRTMTIDWVKVYQPFCCGENKTVVTLNDFDDLTNNTGFLTGKTLTIGNNSMDSPSLQEKLHGPIWRDIPFYFLATDEIQIIGEAKFEGDIYTEMRITDCNGALRAQNTDVTKDEYNGSVITKNSTLKNQDEITLIENNNKNNSDITIYPVPSLDEINFMCDDATFDKITSLILVDVNGIKYNIVKAHTINIESFNQGCYQLIINFNDDKFITKRIVKL